MVISSLVGQKSNGCGYVKLVSVKKSVYTMTDENDRKQWPKEEKAMRDITAEITDKAEAQDQRLHILNCQEKQKVPYSGQSGQHSRLQR